MGEKRAWGYAVQLYSVRSADSWGIGDLLDLADLCTWSSTQHFASYVLVNPLHAAEPMTPLEPSPYLPTSRRYVNPLYVRPEHIPEWGQLSAKDRARIASLKASLADKLAGASFSELEEFALDVRRRAVLEQPDSNLRRIVQERLEHRRDQATG